MRTDRAFTVINNARINAAIFLYTMLANLILLLYSLNTSLIRSCTCNPYIKYAIRTGYLSTIHILNMRYITVALSGQIQTDSISNSKRPETNMQRIYSDTTFILK